MSKKLIHRVAPLLVMAIFAAALWVLYHTLRQYRYREVMAYLGTLPHSRMLLALGLTFLGYFVMTGYDALAFRYIGQHLAYRKIALASFIGYAFNNNVGLSGIVGGSLRYRFYTAWRLSAVDVAKVIAFCTMTFWTGFITLGGAMFLLYPPPLPPMIHLPFHSLRLLGFIFIAAPITYFAWSTFKERSFSIKGWEFSFPSAELFVSQIALSTLDWTIAALVLYLLLPDVAKVSFPVFLGVFLLGQLAGLISNVPGGLGVFEMVIVVFLSSAAPGAQVLGSLLAFRAVYYFAPLVIAVTLLGVHETLERREGVARVARVFGRWAPGIVPQLLAFTSFVGGAILLFSGATPTLHNRIRFLRDIVPLPVVEVSHFLNSMAGVALLVLARGLQRRLDAAYVLTVAFLSAGIGFSLLKGLDYEEAVILGIMLAALLPCRQHFYRKASLINEPFTAGWIAAIAAVLLSTVWLGFFSYKHVDYSHELWWKFSMSADAPRFLRATVGSLAVLLFVGLARLLRPAEPEPELPSPEEVESAAAIVARTAETSSNLALLGDKELLFSESGRSFIMFGVEGRSWIAMGDPVGAPDEIGELIWRFRELSDQHEGWTVFYEIARKNLHHYLDVGLTLLKLGEEARVRLDDFSLEGGSRKGFRKTLRRIETEGAEFEIIQPPIADELIAEIRVISDSWLSEKRTREKRFSLGSFAHDYICRCPLAVVRVHGKAVAFANLWVTGRKEELSVDLMRHLEEAPNGIMDFLFINLMLWGKANGYAWFNLGVAPLSGLENRALGPLWNRLGAIAFRRGETFYNFRGLRQYKEKFDPVWEPVYLASPGGLALPRILTNLAALIAGGSIKGAVAK